MYNKMADILMDLKDNYHVLAVKAEFEEEGSRKEEVFKLKELAAKSGLNLNIKIGGCAAVRDMLDVKDIGVNTIIAPMIETPYALKKFVEATQNVFSSDNNQPKYLINIETITGYQNFNDMIESPYFTHISGVVLGRNDMIGSMGIPKNEVDSSIIFNIANSISQKLANINKEFTIGGEVSSDSIPFFKKLSKTLTKFETRKIIFNAQKILEDENNAILGIQKALEFEIMWLKNKKNTCEEDIKRISILEARGIINK